MKSANVYIHYKLKKYIPFALYLPLTYDCNLRCKFCDVWKNKSKELSKDQIFSVIDDAKKIGIPYISVFGGEPLLRNSVEAIGKRIKDNGIVAALTTNGFLIDKNRAKSLTDAYDIIKVSFCGLEKTRDKCTGVHGSFKKSLQGLSLLLKYAKRTQINIHYVVREDNLNEVDAFVAKFKDRVNAIHFLPENNLDKKFASYKFKNKWKELKKTQKIADSNNFIDGLTSNKTICDAGRLYYTILPDGSVNACNGHQKIILGDVKTSFYKIYRKGLSKEHNKIIQTCKGCYMKCTTEVSQIFRMPIHKLIWNLPSLMKTYGLL